MKRVYVFIFCLLITCLVSSALAFAEDKPARLIVRVTDETGAVVTGARILIPDGSARARSCVVAVTGDSGTTEVDLAPGSLDVFVSAAGFLPQAVNVELKKGKTKQIEIRLKIKGEMKTIE